MSLIECLECGGTVSERAKACPHCGAPVEIKNTSDIEFKKTPESENRYNKMMLQAISSYEKSIATIILLCIQNLEFELGVHKLTQILTGAQTKFITDYELQNNPAYSLLKQYSRNDIKEVIEILEIMGYIQQETVNFSMQVLCLTDKAYDFFDGRENFEGTFIDVLTKNDFIELDEEQNILYEKLRQKRNMIAKENDIPAYTVCYDKTLRYMALTSPASEDELLSIKGIGPAFVGKYGEEFIKAILKFNNRIEENPTDIL